MKKRKEKETEHILFLHENSFSNYWLHCNFFGHSRALCQLGVTPPNRNLPSSLFQAGTLVEVNLGSVQPRENGELLKLVKNSYGLHRNFCPQRNKDHRKKWPGCKFVSNEKKKILTRATFDSEVINSTRRTCGISSLSRSCRPEHLLGLTGTRKSKTDARKKKERKEDSTMVRSHEIHQLFVCQPPWGAVRCDRHILIHSTV